MRALRRKFNPPRDPPPGIGAVVHRADHDGSSSFHRAWTPVLAFADMKLAWSGRGASFWFRACAFEVFTVFGSAAMLRLAIHCRF